MTLGSIKNRKGPNTSKVRLVTIQEEGEEKGDLLAREQMLAKPAFVRSVGRPQSDAPGFKLERTEAGELRNRKFPA